MSPYLTYEEYQSSGGTAELSAFPVLERLARAKLDYWTMGRIKEPDCDVRLCMVLIINALAERESNAHGVTGFSNDGVSVSYAQLRTEDEITESVYRQVVEILPVELVSVVLT